MKNLLRVSDLTIDEVEKIFALARELEETPLDDKLLKNKTFIYSFRTQVFVQG